MTTTPQDSPAPCTPAPSVPEISLSELREYTDAAKTMKQAIAATRTTREVPLSQYRMKWEGHGKTRTFVRIPPAGKAFRDNDRDFKSLIARILDKFPEQITSKVSTATTWRKAESAAEDTYEDLHARWAQQAGIWFPDH